MMTRRLPTGGLLLSVALVLAIALAVPCCADYDKFFRFKNRTDDDQPNLFVVVDALEVFTAYYDNVLWCPWGDPTAGQTTINGVPCSTLTYSKAGVSIPCCATAESRVRIGWNTADHSCRLRGMYWGTTTGGTAITDATDGGTVPGGGTLEKVGNNYRWTIINDTDGAIPLTNVEWDIFDSSVGLDKDDLLIIAEEGIIGKRLSLVPGAANARDDNKQAFEAYADGDRATANTRWGNAATAAGKVADNAGAARGGKMGRVKNRLANRRGGNGPPLEDEPAGIKAKLAARRGNTVDSFSFMIPGNQVNVGDSLVIHGQVLDNNNVVVVDWVDRVVIDANVPAGN